MGSIAPAQSAHLLALVQVVRACPLDDCALFDRVERQPRPDLPELVRLRSDGQAGLTRAVYEFYPPEGERHAREWDAC